MLTVPLVPKGLVDVAYVLNVVVAVVQDVELPKFTPPITMVVQEGCVIVLYIYILLAEPPIQYKASIPAPLIVAGYKKPKLPNGCLFVVVLHP